MGAERRPADIHRAGNGPSEGYRGLTGNIIVRGQVCEGFWLAPHERG